jgi:hypothetical protein
MSYANGPRIVTDGLVLHLDAANRKSYPGSGSTWYDLSGNNYHGSINSATFADNTFNFDGTDDYIDLSSHASNLIFDSPVTINSFIFPTSDISVSNTILSLSNGISDITTDNLDGFAMRYGNSTSSMTNETFTLAKNVNQQTPNVQSTVNIDGDLSLGNTYRNKWVNYVVRSNSTSWNIKVNDTSLTLTGSSYWNGNLFGFGEDISPKSKVGIGCLLRADFVNMFNGKIAMVSIYNRELTNAELTQNYNAFKGRYGLT